MLKQIIIVLVLGLYFETCSSQYLNQSFINRDSLIADLGFSLHLQGKYYVPMQCSPFRNNIDVDLGPGIRNIYFGNNQTANFLVYDSTFNYVDHFKVVESLSSGAVFSSVSQKSQDNIVSSFEFSDSIQFLFRGNLVKLVSHNRPFVADMALIKLNEYGLISWYKEFKLVGDSSQVSLNHLGVDDAQNIYYCVYLKGQMIVDSVRYTSNTNGIAELFLFKINSLGVVSWVLPFDYAAIPGYLGGLGSLVSASLVKVNNDKLGNVYVCGNYSGVMDLDPTTGVDTFNLNLHNNGGNTFISKLDSSGHYLFTKELKTTNENNGNLLLTDDPNRFILSGYFFDTLNISFDSSRYNLIGRPFPSVLNYKLITNQSAYVAILDSNLRTLYAFAHIDSNGCIPSSAVLTPNGLFTSFKSYEGSVIGRNYPANSYLYFIDSSYNVFFFKQDSSDLSGYLKASLTLDSELLLTGRSVLNLDIDFFDSTTYMVNRGTGFYFTGIYGPQKPLGFPWLQGKQTSITAYPNPGSKSIYFSGLDAGQTYTATLSNLQGQKVLTQNLNHTTGIDITSLQAGVYLYTISSRQAVYNGKVVVAR